MKLDDITPLVLTHNEEVNIERTLNMLDWAPRIVVIDSGSTDATTKLVQKYRNVKLLQRPFDNHTSQWNFGLSQIESEWVLALDADYVCPVELPQELCALSPGRNAYTAGFRYCVQGRPLRGTLYPPRIVLFRVGRFQFRADGHTQVLKVDEPVGKLQNAIVHDDRKSLTRWLGSQTAYADLEVDKLISTPGRRLGWKDRLRKGIVVAPLLTLVYCLFWKRLLLDGWPGIYYSVQRTYAELLLSLKLLDVRLGGQGSEEKRNLKNGRQTVGVCGGAGGVGRENGNYQKTQEIN